MLADHNRIVRGQLDRFHGREADTTGDGFLATFASAEAAVRAGVAISDVVRDVGLSVRIGIHTGEIEVGPTELRGIAIHATARIMSLGQSSEVLVSATTRGLVDNKEIEFKEHGQHQLKGLDRPIEVYRVARARRA